MQYAFPRSGAKPLEGSFYRSDVASLLLKHHQCHIAAVSAGAGAAAQHAGTTSGPSTRWPAPTPDQATR